MNGISDLSAMGMDGFNAKIFKATWYITKYDIIKAVEEFFEKGKIYKAINCTLFALIPKMSTSRMVKDFMSISCCTILYKIISRTMAGRLGKFLNNIIH